MFKNSISILLFFLFSVAHLGAQQTINGTLEHDNIEREYILYVPASYDPATPVPLVLSFHGYTSSAEVNFQYTNFTNIADTAGFILVHPMGTLLAGSSHWNVGGWTLESNTDDVGFTEALLDELSATYNINQDRIYSTGMSNGGFMSFLLACQLSDRIAAIASVTGSMTPQTFDACNPQHPTPVLQIHGTTDAVVPYIGNPLWTESIEDVLDYWVNFNNCNNTPEVIDVPNIDILDNSYVDHFIYKDGTNGVTTEHFKVFFGGHDWPGAWGNMDIDASVEVWRFFSRYDINGLIDSGPVATNEVSKQAALLELFPNPSAGIVQLKGEFSPSSSFQIYTSNGILVQQGSLSSTNPSLDISALPAGLYLIQADGQRAKLVKSN